MKKLRSDSRLARLSEEQKEIVMRWLSDENISCQEAADRIWQRFGIKTSRSPVSEFYHRQIKERILAPSSALPQTSTVSHAGVLVEIRLKALEDPPLSGDPEISKN